MVSLKDFWPFLESFDVGWPLCWFLESPPFKPLDGASFGADFDDDFDDDLCLSLPGFQEDGDFQCLFCFDS